MCIVEQRASPISQIPTDVTGASVSSHYLATRDTRTRIKGCPGDVIFVSNLLCPRLTGE